MALSARNTSEMDRFTLQERFVIAGLILLLVGGVLTRFFRGVRHLESAVPPSATVSPAP